MGSLEPEMDPKLELNDSGYVQEDTKDKSTESDYKGTTELLDLSDDVLLYILRYCSPRDLKALGYTCPRLGSLILDRTLWQYVDARGQPTGKRRMRWFLNHGLNSNTTALLISGYAREAKGCLGFINGPREKIGESLKTGSEPGTSSSQPGTSKDNTSTGPVTITVEETESPLFRLSPQNLPRYGGGVPFWPENLPNNNQTKKTAKNVKNSPVNCGGPQLSFTHMTLHTLKTKCRNLRELALEHCVIDCLTTNISMFPPTLKKLSLLGTKCFNLEKSFLFKIQDYLLELEELDVSCCEWVEPACMLPLSKMPKLSNLAMRECPKLAEFVAYASLATRYGFKALKVLDLRGSPVGDSEVSALGWVPLLERLYLSAAVLRPRPADHAHYAKDSLPVHVELDEWEEQEPDYFKSKLSASERLKQEQNFHGNHNCYPNIDDPSSYILLERMIGEPVIPEDYRHFYSHFHRLNPEVGQNGCVLINPLDYGNAYRNYITRTRIHRNNGGLGGFIISNSGVSQRAYNLHPRADGEGRGDRNADNADRNADNADRNEDNGDERPGVSSDGNKDKGKGDERKTAGKGDERKTAGKGDESKGDNEDSKGRDDDDSDDGQPKPKRVRIAINEGASTSKVDVKSKIGDEINKDKDSSTADGTLSPKAKENEDGDEHSRIALTKGIKMDTKPKIDGDKKSESDKNDDDDQPKPKRSRIAINDGAGTSKIGDESTGDETNNDLKDDIKKESGDKHSQINNASNTKPGDENTSSKDEGASDDESKSKHTSINDGASTSKDIDNVSDVSNCATYATSTKSDDSDASTVKSDISDGSTVKSDITNWKKQKFIGFLPRPPTIAAEERRNNIENDMRNNNIYINANVPADETQERHRILYVNVGRRRHAMYELSLPVCTIAEPVDLSANNFAPNSRNISSLIYASHIATRLDHSSLVTDSAITRFGRADGDNINYIQIGPNGPVPAPVNDPQARPNRSNLRVLSVTGFRHITNASLLHLATAAPHLELLDFSGTNVTESGVEHFKSINPNCEVRFSKFERKDDAPT